MTEMKSTLKALQALRGETQLKIHLAGMELKQTWDTLQPKLDEAENVVKRATDSVSEAMLEAMKVTAQELEKLAQAL